MSFEGWKRCLDPKVQGSWNLHTLLPRDLDFFILLSSMMGTIGGASLTAYSAANAYMDALARHRVSLGERGVALGLGVVADSGFLVEDKTRLMGVEGVEKYAFTREKEIFALLEIYCDPSPFNEFPRDVIKCQPVTGIRPPAHWHHLEDVTATFQQPFWGHMHHVPGLVLDDGDKATDDAEAVRLRRTRALGVAERLAAADSLAEAGQIATEALAQRISVVLGTAEDRLDVNNPLHSYGIDSLSALDVRNWVGHFFDVDLPVFEILGGATLTTAGLTIAKKFQLKS